MCTLDMFRRPRSGHKISVVVTFARLTANLALIIYPGFCIPLEKGVPVEATKALNKPETFCHASEAFFNQTQKCYEVNSSGPCGQLMRFQRMVNNTLFGVCNCKQTPAFGCATRPTVFWPDNNRCFYIFDQGPCPDGQWLVSTPNNSSRCVANPCLYEYNEQEKPADSIDVDPDPKFVFSYANQCYTSVTTNQNLCDSDEAPYFLPNTGFKHVCMNAARLGCPLPIVNYRECDYGTEPNFTGGCERGTSLDYEF